MTIVLPSLSDIYVLLTSLSKKGGYDILLNCGCCLQRRFQHPAYPSFCIGYSTVIRERVL